MKLKERFVYFESFVWRVCYLIFRSIEAEGACARISLGEVVRKSCTAKNCPGLPDSSVHIGY